MNSNRIVITHVHIFKNAGTTFDWILKKNFDQNFLDHRKPMEMRKGGSEYLKKIYTDTPELVAVSSHHIPFNPKVIENEDIAVLPVYFMREPLDRSLSVYKFEKKQKNIQNEGTKMAKELDFPEYVKWSLTERKARTLRNMNTMYASGIRDVSNDIELEHAYINLKNSLLVGVVDRFDESMVVFEEALKVYFPEIDLAYVSQNVNQTEKKSPSEKEDEIKELLGIELYEKVKTVNTNDLKLYKYANSLLDERILEISDFQLKLECFKERCNNLVS